jgi:hypothetical protein
LQVLQLKELARFHAVLEAVLTVANLGLTRFRGQVAGGHEMNARLFADDQPIQDLTQIH